MANTFKNALKRNVGTSAVSVYTAPAAKNAICIELDVCNTTTSGVTVDVFITKYSDSLNYYLIKTTPVPVGGSLQVIAGQKIVLSDGDILKVISSVASSIDVVAAILEDV